MLLFGVKLLLNILVSCRGQKISPNCDPSPSQWEVFPAKVFFPACRLPGEKEKGKKWPTGNRRLVRRWSRESPRVVEVGVAGALAMPFLFPLGKSSWRERRASILAALGRWDDRALPSLSRNLGGPNNYSISMKKLENWLVSLIWKEFWCFVWLFGLKGGSISWRRWPTSRSSVSCVCSSSSCKSKVRNQAPSDPGT